MVMLRYDISGLIYRIGPHWNYAVYKADEPMSRVEARINCGRIIKAADIEVMEPVVEMRIP